MVYCTVHPSSVEAFFAEAEARGARMIAGKVMMDRNAPRSADGHAAARLRREQGADRALARPRQARLRDHAAVRGDVDAGATGGGGSAGARISATATSRPMSTRTRPRSRRRRAVPRGAELSRRLRAGRPAGAALGLRPLHPSGGERGRRARRKPASPRSARPRTCSSARACSIRRGSAQAGVRIALATDVGGGTSYSMLRTAAEAYKVLQLNGQSWPALEAFYQ